MRLELLYPCDLCKEGCTYQAKGIYKGNARPLKVHAPLWRVISVDISSLKSKPTNILSTERLHEFKKLEFALINFSMEFTISLKTL